MYRIALAGRLVAAEREDTDTAADTAAAVEEGFVAVW
jgi:hypothetical protein